MWIPEQRGFVSSRFCRSFRFRGSSRETFSETTLDSRSLNSAGTGVAFARFVVVLVILLSVVCSGNCGKVESVGVQDSESKMATSTLSQRGAGATSGENAMKKEVSVIVPCYEEQLNIRPLTERIFAATKKAGITAEVVLVDDYSGKGSEESKKVVAELKKEGYQVNIHVRMPEQGKGLSSAVLHGFSLAKYDCLVCMDADLQHEPESLPAITEPILSKKADFTVGSRHVEGGGAKEFALVRKLISFVATALAYPLTISTDPMSGYFSLNKETLSKAIAAKLNPLGFKIGLELMVKSRCKVVQDVPIQFREREHGESKLTFKQNILYLQHLFLLYWFRYPGQLVALFLLGLVILYFVYLQAMSLLFHNDESIKQD